MPKFELFFMGSNKIPSDVFAQGLAPLNESKEPFAINDMMGGPRTDCVLVSETFESAVIMPDPKPYLLQEGENHEPSFVYLVAVDTERDELDYFNQHHKIVSESTLEHVVHLHMTNKFKHHVVRAIPKEHVLAAYSVVRRIDIKKQIVSDNIHHMHMDFVSFNISPFTHKQDPGVLSNEAFNTMPEFMKKYEEENKRIMDMGLSTQPSPVAYDSWMPQMMMGFLRALYFVLKKNKLSQMQNTLFGTQAQPKHHLPSLFDQAMAGDFDHEIKNDEARLKDMLDDFFSKEAPKRGADYQRLKNNMGDKIKEFGMLKTMKILDMLNPDDPELVTFYSDPEPTESTAPTLKRM